VPRAVVSVLMPARNVASTIGDAIESVRRQTFESWELIVVDDGSDDETAEVVRSIPDDRVTLVRQQWRGVSAARNRAAKNAGGKFLAFLDADDLFAPDKLERQVGFLDERPDVGSTYSAHRRVDADGIPWTVHSPAPRLEMGDFLAGFPFNPSSQMVRPEWHLRVGGFREELYLNEDRDYWLRLSAAGCAFERTDGVLADYRMRRAGTMRDWPSHLEQALTIIDRFAEQLPATAAEARFQAYQEYALQAAASGDLENTRSYFVTLLRKRPKLPTHPDCRDDFLQAVVELAVRSRGRFEPILDGIFNAFDGRMEVFCGERDWAMGSAAWQCGARELAWGRREAARAAFRVAASRRVGLDTRTQSLMRFQCQQYRGAFGDDAWKMFGRELTETLGQFTSRREAERFVESVQPSRSFWSKLREAVRA